MWFLNILCNKIGQSPSAEYQSTVVALRKKKSSCSYLSYK